MKLRQVVLLLSAATILGCHSLAAPSDEERPALGRVPARGVRQADDPSPADVLQAYSVAFAVGNLNAVSALLADDFLYIVDYDCARLASCGTSFPWDKPTELTWLGSIITASSERGCDFTPDAPTALPGHRWQVVSGVSLFYQTPQGYLSCHGSLTIQFITDRHGNLVIESMRPRRWFRSDDGCALVHFRCPN